MTISRRCVLLVFPVLGGGMCFHTKDNPFVSVCVCVPVCLSALMCPILRLILPPLFRPSSYLDFPPPCWPEDPAALPAAAALRPCVPSGVQSSEPPCLPRSQLQTAARTARHSQNCLRQIERPQAHAAAGKCHWMSGAIRLLLCAQLPLRRSQGPSLLVVAVGPSAHFVV